jgi:hypothetical protein
MWKQGHATAEPAGLYMVTKGGFHRDATRLCAPHTLNAVTVVRVWYNGYTVASFNAIYWLACRLVPGWVSVP